MVRSDVRFEVGAAFVVVERGVLFTDPGAVVHDPWQPLGALENASTLGRPVERRPVALFLGFERDPYLADWVRSLVNGLVRRAAEGRIAVPEPTAGLHLTRPCAPTEESVKALNPRVVVALDDEAVELSTLWLGRDAFGLVRLTPDTSGEITTGYVGIGRSRPKLEATIGRGVNHDAMADLVHRLDQRGHMP
jgi:hypothetical protein